jgi:hypothetical protein
MSHLSASRSNIEKFSAYDAYAEHDGRMMAAVAATDAQEGCGTWEGRAATRSWWRIRRSRESGHQSRTVLGFLNSPPPPDSRWYGHLPLGFAMVTKQILLLDTPLL